MSILLDEADAYERGMDDDLTFQTVRELAGTAYMAGRSAPPTAVEIEAVAKKTAVVGHGTSLGRRHAQ